MPATVDCRRGPARRHRRAIDGSLVAHDRVGRVDFAAMLDHARNVGGPALRKLTFHDRAHMIKGARPRDHGAQGRALRAQLPHRRDAQGRLDRHRGRRGHAAQLLVEGPPRAARRAMSCSTGRSSPCRRPAASSASTSTRRCRAPRSTSTPSTSRCGGCSKSSPRPCSPGCPRSSSRPARPLICAKPRCGSWSTPACFPTGALQLIVGGVGDLFDHLTCQDMVSFTGSAATALKLQTHPVVAARNRQIRRRAGQPQRLVLGPDAAPGTPEFDLFVAKWSMR